MKEIPLTKGKVALVDDEDFLYLSQWRWRVCQKGYAVRTIHPKPGTNRQVFMHRDILKTDSACIDHADGNTINNQKSNLRPCTKSQNAANSKIRSTNTSGHVGVIREKRYGTWIAQIVFLGKNIRRSFATFEEAVRERERMSREYFGEFSGKKTITINPA